MTQCQHLWRGPMYLTCSWRNQTHWGICIWDFDHPEGWTDVWRSGTSCCCRHEGSLATRDDLKKEARGIFAEEKRWCVTLIPTLLAPNKKPYHNLNGFIRLTYSLIIFLPNSFPMKLRYPSPPSPCVSSRIILCRAIPRSTIGLGTVCTFIPRKLANLYFQVY